MKITGVMVQYYKACKRELWFFANQINMNYDDDNIEIGRMLHENSYSDERKNIIIDDTIAIDFIKKEGEHLIFEVKKSSKLKIPALYQLYYYLWYLKKNKGININGMLVYPKEKRKEEILLTPEIENEIEFIVNDIPKILESKIPPKAENRKYCKRCSYYEFCRV